MSDTGEWLEFLCWLGSRSETAAGGILLRLIRYITKKQRLHFMSVLLAEYSKIPGTEKAYAGKERPS